MDLEIKDPTLCSKIKTCPAVGCSKGVKVATTYYQENHVGATPDGQGGIMVVGLYPSYKEIEEQTNMVGKSGQLFRGMVSRAIQYHRFKHTLDDADQPAIFITNVIRCRPETSKKRELYASAVQCSIHMAAEIEAFKPAVIIACGELAAMFFTGKIMIDSTLIVARNAAQKFSTIRRQRGKYQKPPFTYHGIPVILTWNPARVIREEDTGTRINLENQIYQDLIEVIHVWKRRTAAAVPSVTGAPAII